MTEVASASVKSFGEFEDILAAENPDVWESHRPAEGGAAGKMLRDIIERAARIKAGRKSKGGKKVAKGRPRRASSRA